MSDTITANKIGIFNYELTNDAGEIMDSSQGQPMPYLHGCGNIIPDLEEHMEGKTIGDKFQVVIPPEKGYGEYDEKANFSVHRSELDKNVLEDLKPGSQFFINDEQGKPVPIFVVKMEGAYVHFTQNHPLAGQTLHFDIEVVGIRDANEEEVKHGHPHGIDGTHGHHH
jgi:FKBP-type peptidyl-prolyl cis-trans isomerase SlyD